MNSIAVSLTVFACVFGGAVCGILLRRVLPQDHLSADSKQVVTMSMGLVATMAALVLGLLVTSAKSYYDAQSAELTQMSAKVILLDRLLAHYGQETKEVRDLLFQAFAQFPRAVEFTLTRLFFNLPSRFKSLGNAEIAYSPFECMGCVRQSGSVPSSGNLSNP